MRHVGGRKLRLLVAVGLIAVGIAAIAQASSAATEQGRSVRIAIFTDCKGAFATAYENRHRRRERGVLAVRRRQAEEQEQALGRAHRRQCRRGQARFHRLRLRRRHAGHDPQGDPAADGAAERRRDGRPAVGRRGSRHGQLGQEPPRQDHHHRHRRFSGPDDADRSEERVPLLRRRRAVERRHRRDPLQEVGLAKCRGNHGRLQLRVDVRGRLHRRLLWRPAARSRGACSRR